MLYWLHRLSDYWGAFDIFRTVTFRGAFAAMTAFIVSITLGPLLIAYLRTRKITEQVSKKDSLKLEELHRHKAMTPTMGGAIVLASLLGAILLWARLDSFYTHLMLFTAVSLGCLGMYDDAVKLFHPGKKGLEIWQKMFFQTLIAAIVAGTLYRWGDPSVVTKLSIPTIPAHRLPDLGIFFVLFAMLVLVASSNAVNLTDGLDGLAIGCTVLAAAVYAAIAYAAGHAGMAAHLQILRVPGAEEVAVACAALCGACLGFLWFNAHPAEIFMGDTGSLAIGGVLGLTALMVKQEILLVVVGGVFVAEAASVLAQIVSFRLAGRRVLPIAPLHHALEFYGWRENKIVVRFWIVSAVLAIFSLCALRLN